MLLETFPRLQSVLVERVDSHAIVVAVAERKPYALWCGDVFNAEMYELNDCWFIDENGEMEPHRIRGNVDFCAGSNNGFSSPLADATKLALRNVTREAYTDESSVLYQAEVRVPGFFHDELFTEMNEDLAHIAGPRIAQIMHDALQVYTPDVFTYVDTALMKHWSKDAEPVYDENKKLIPWYPKVKK